MKVSIKFLRKSNTIRLYSNNKDQKFSFIELANNRVSLNANIDINNKNITIKTKRLKFNCKELKINSSNKILIKNSHNELLLNNYNIKMSFEDIQFDSDIFKVTSPYINFYA